MDEGETLEMQSKERCLKSWNHFSNTSKVIRLLGMNSFNAKTDKKYAGNLAWFLFKFKMEQNLI